MTHRPIGSTLRGLGAALVGAALAACSDTQPTAPVRAPAAAPSRDVHTLAKPRAVVTGALTASRTFTADTEYVLSGLVTVEAPATLTVQAGTTVFGDSGSNPSALVIKQGAKITAIGSRFSPIVFTSIKPEGTRARGDWGGVVIIGRSVCNQYGSELPASSQCLVEGIPGDTLRYGQNPPVTNDNSGSLKYVRIEFAGFQLVTDNELNGLSLYAVGSGTSIDRVQSHFGSDDGIEVFGGTVNLTHLLITGASDDSFDYSFGWSGKAQYIIAQQSTNDGDKGFEVDNDEDASSNYNNRPQTNPLIYNVTLIGRYPGNITSGQNTGIHLRRGAAGQLFNVIVYGFRSSALDVDDAVTFPFCDISSSPRLRVSNIIYNNNNGNNYEPDADPNGTTTQEADCDQNTRTTSVKLIDLLGRGPGTPNGSPDFRPASGSPARTGYATPPADGFFTTAKFLGGVAPDVTPWYSDWSAFPQS